MSSFIVPRNLINRILTHVESRATEQECLNHTEKTFAATLRKLFPAPEGAPCDVDPDNFLDNGLGDRAASGLCALNLAAYRTRYGHNAEIVAHADEVEAEMDADAGHLYFRNPAHPATVVQSISCLLYQCSESAEIEASPLFVALDALRHGMALDLVAAMPETNAVPWGE